MSIGGLGAAGFSTGASGLSTFGLGAATNQKYGEPQIPSGALAGGAGTGADIVYNEVYDLDCVDGKRLYEARNSFSV